MECEYEEEFITKEEYLKNLDLQDFLNCEETKDILEMECYNKFELGLKLSLMRIFENCAKTYSSESFLFNDYQKLHFVRLAVAFGLFLFSNSFNFSTFFWNLYFSTKSYN